MINWQALLFNSFWIVGLAVLFAAFSYHHWAARQTQTSLRVQFNQPSFLIFFWLSFVLVCMGLAGTTRQLWEIAIWIAFALLGFLFMVRAIVVYRSESAQSDRLQIGD
ncbi:MAG: hypothetical protein KJ069_20710 [Anaerolineae bacterium]|nr:hypothetical protein [Anaerolineae bacterium]